MSIFRLNRWSCSWRKKSCFDLNSIWKNFQKILHLRRTPHHWLFYCIFHKINIVFRGFCIQKIVFRIQCTVFPGRTMFLVKFAFILQTFEYFDSNTFPLGDVCKYVTLQSLKYPKGQRDDFKDISANNCNQSPMQEIN